MRPEGFFQALSSRWNRDPKLVFWSLQFLLFLGLLSGETGWRASPPLIVWYEVLIFNTYFSIDFFTRLVEPSDVDQRRVDEALGLLYCLLPFFLGSLFFFEILALLLFLIAILKYILLLKKKEYRQTLRKKIYIDILGCLGCAGALIGTVLGFGETTAWIWTILFTLANIYLLLIRPMYRFSA